jgi:hypothetical protein
MKRNGRCLCGLLLKFHLDKRNRSLSCDQAKAAHPSAKVKRNSFLRMLRNS